ncbi:hypothetical protein ACD591_18455 [Rufibacter glacialis]|uniref:Glycosyltransferase RgtA/B/C/D-like domain-containing protein n=1 Tax=Rufibacter glacialis TaxID=1259555 RepID=A0A5M8QSE0_9BACT|nr:hypothetical protein [Rufibacter glacialis]KAA6438188.1 hypothetical protein FOE74_00695 [Rufibacter glacialis]GGK89349.1 hypothetical protein GCM10011405_41380 [Rufibacter glacialis]
MSFAASVRQALPVVLPFMALLVGLTWYVQGNGFFWDSILLASKYGQWYYHTRFSTLFVPADLAGYPPLFGMYLAAGWHLFGKTLPVSHFLMLPFLLGLVWQVYLLARHFLPPSGVWVGLLLVFLDPTVLAQAAQVAPDIVLLFLYLLCLNALLQHRPFLSSIGLVLMAVHTPRSQLLLGAVFLTYLLLSWLEEGSLTFSKIRRKLLPFLPAALVLLAWLGLHYQHFGWVGFSRSSAWGSYAAWASPVEILRNLVLICWRLLDFGRVSLWLTAGVLLWTSRKNLTLSTRQLLILLLVPLAVLSLVLVWFTNPIGHRYWLVVYVALGLLVAHLVQQISRPRRLLVVLVLVGSLASGHFWVYPEKIAKGWDASLAHLPYFKLRHQMLSYLDQQKIPWQEVGSDFPNLASPAETDLTADHRRFPAKDLKTQRYIFYSNVFNGFTDQELTALQQEWVVVQELKEGLVYVRLYGKK